MPRSVSRRAVGSEASTPMSEIVVARDALEKRAMHAFLQSHGVPLQGSVDFQAMGVVRDGSLIAVVAFNGFCGRVCSMHVAGDGGHWISRALLDAVFDYPFRQLDLAAVLAPIAASNEHALRFDTHLGFTEAHRVPEGWARGVDLIILEMRREACRYLKGARDEQQAA